MAQPPAPIIHLPLNPPVGPQHPQAGGNMGGEVNGGPGQQPHARGGQDKSAPHTGVWVRSGWAKCCLVRDGDPRMEIM